MSFEAQHAGIYFGRDAEILELRERLNEMTDKGTATTVRRRDIRQRQVVTHKSGTISEVEQKRIQTMVCA